VGKRCGRMNIVQILCTYICKWRYKTIPGMGRGEDKGDDGGGELKYNIFDIL
jgi:hypothetical protein